MTNRQFRVYVVDDDRQICVALARVLALAGYEVQAFADAEAFLSEHNPDTPGCAIVDLALPGMSGLEVQQELRRCARPVIFLSAQGSIHASVEAIKAGALDFLEKPIDAEVLVATVARAKLAYESTQALIQNRHNFDVRVNKLTPRERQVLEYVVVGRLNKQIAGDLGVVEKTIKVHRGRMMDKMGVRTVAELVKIICLYGDQSSFPSVFDSVEAYDQPSWTQGQLTRTTQSHLKVDDGDIPIRHSDR